MNLVKFFRPVPSMILTLCLFSVIQISFSAHAQVVGVQTDSNSPYTKIEVRKSGRPEMRPAFEITEGTDDIAGDPAPLALDARTSWKEACKTWKNELKELNKENHILTLSCGNPTCAREEALTLCSSKTKYKIKTRINEEVR